MQRERAPLSVEAACAPNSRARVLAGVAGRHLRGRGGAAIDLLNPDGPDALVKKLVNKTQLSSFDARR